MHGEAWAKASVRSAVILAFAYREAETAIIAMDAGSDSDFATWFGELGTELVTHGAVDLSHNAGAASIQFVITPQVALEATGELLDAYDRLRASRGRGRPPELRETVQAMFKLRERLMDAEDTPTEAPADTAAAWLDWPLDRFPIPTATINKLRRADLYTLRQIDDEEPGRVCGLTGLTEKQLERLNELVWGYLCAATDMQERVGIKLVDTLSELLGEPIKIDPEEMVNLATSNSWSSCALVLMGSAEFAVRRYVGLIKGMKLLEAQPIPWSTVFAEIGEYSREGAREVPNRFALAGIESVSDLLRCEDDLIEELSGDVLVWVTISQYLRNAFDSMDAYYVKKLAAVVQEPARLQMIRKVSGRY